jgi:hypothetical protein
LFLWSDKYIWNGIATVQSIHRKGYDIVIDAVVCDMLAAVCIVAQQGSALLACILDEIHLYFKICL